MTKLQCKVSNRIFKYDKNSKQIERSLLLYRNDNEKLRLPAINRDAHRSISSFIVRATNRNTRKKRLNKNDFN